MASDTKAVRAKGLRELLLELTGKITNQTGTEEVGIVELLLLRSCVYHFHIKLLTVFLQGKIKRANRLTILINKIKVMELSLIIRGLITNHLSLLFRCQTIPCTFTSPHLIYLLRAFS